MRRTRYHALVDWFKQLTKFIASVLQFTFFIMVYLSICHIEVK